MTFESYLGYNFNAITCESCKAFFRRNATRQKDFTCSFNKTCKLDSSTRKFCKYCRLKKCLDLGMKKEWILSEEERQSLRNKIEENRKKRKIITKVEKVINSTTSYKFPNVVQLIQNSFAVNSEKISNSCSYNESQDIEIDLIEKSKDKHSMDSNQSSSQLSFESNKSSINFENIDNCDSYEECSNCFETDCSVSKSRHFPNDSINSDINTFVSQISLNCNDLSIESIKNSFIESNKDLKTVSNDMQIATNDNCAEKDNISDSVYQRAVELEFASISFRQYMIDSNDIKFNKCENERIQELTNACNTMRRSCDVKITSELTGIYDATKVLAIRSEEAIRRIVAMSKMINAFQDLCQDDQIALMKACCFEILIMRSVYSYNSEHEYWSVLMDQDNATMLKLDIFKQAKGNAYEAHRKFMQSFQQEWDKDWIVLDLLTAIVIFTPERPNILHKQIIKLEQQIYMHLLQRYLLSKSKSKCEAKTKFLRLMSKVEELHILHDTHIRIYLEADPQDVGPLILEILDLNPYKTY